VILKCSFTITVFLVSSIIWLEFSIFYLLGAPINVACNAVNGIMYTDYALPFQVPETEFTANLQDLHVNPGKFLDGCSAGSTVFEIKINRKQQSIIAFLHESSGQLVNSSNFNNILDKDSLKTSIQLPDFSTRIQEVDQMNLTAFDTSKLKLDNINLNFTLSETIEKSNASINSLTPETFEPDLGRRDVMLTRSSDFNLFAQQKVPSFCACWTHETITATYVQEGQQFNVRIRIQR
jgi:hypothetical protein